MKRTLSFILVIMLSWLSAHVSATEYEAGTLEEVMTSLKDAYGQYYDRNREPISIPATITSQYQSLKSTLDLSSDKLNAFIRETTQNIENFSAAEKIKRESDQTLDYFDMRLLKYGIRSTMSEAVLAIDSAYFDTIESEHFTGADMLAYEKRYYSAIQDYTKDGLTAFSAFNTLFDIDYELMKNTRQLIQSEKLLIVTDIEDFRTAQDMAMAHAQNIRWTAANEAIQRGITLGNQLNSKIKTILDNRLVIMDRHKTLATELKTLVPKIDKLGNKLERYKDELDEPCTQTIVDYSCADRCPEIRELDIIFKYYKDVPDYQCLSKCSHAEREDQADYDRETEACVSEGRRITSKAKDLQEERNDLIYRYKRALKELKSIESEFSAE